MDAGVDLVIDQPAHGRQIDLAIVVRGDVGLPDTFKRLLHDTLLRLRKNSTPGENKLEAYTIISRPAHGLTGNPIRLIRVWRIFWTLQKSRACSGRPRTWRRK